PRASSLHMAPRRIIDREAALAGSEAPSVLAFVRDDTDDDAERGAVLRGERPPPFAADLHGTDRVDHNIKPGRERSVTHRFGNEVGRQTGLETGFDAGADNRRLDRVNR